MGPDNGEESGTVICKIPVIAHQTFIQSNIIQTELRIYGHTVLAQKALQYLLGIRQEFAELGQFLCTVTLPGPLPHVLHNLRWCAAEKENSSGENGITFHSFTNTYLFVARVLEQETSMLPRAYDATSAFFKTRKAREYGKEENTKDVNSIPMSPVFVSFELGQAYQTYHSGR